VEKVPLFLWVLLCVLSTAAPPKKTAKKGAMKKVAPKAKGGSTKTAPSASDNEPAPAAFSLEDELGQPVETDGKLPAGASPRRRGPSPRPAAKRPGQSSRRPRDGGHERPRMKVALCHLCDFALFSAQEKNPRSSKKIGVFRSSTFSPFSPAPAREKQSTTVGGQTYDRSFPRPPC